MRKRPGLGRRWRLRMGMLVCLSMAFPDVAALAANAAGGSETVDKLLHHSSAAVRLDASDNEAARAKRREAEAYYVRAIEAKNKGQTDREAELLREATKAMITAVQLASREAVTEEKQRMDFQERIASAEVMLSAYDRVRAEEGDTASDASVAQTAREKLARARQDFDSGRIADAQTTADEAYASVRAGIGRLRGGDRLVRSLNFASEAEEYRYELDRNDTHRMLIEMLRDKTANRSVAETVRPLLAQAEDLRRKAEAAAATGQHASAIGMIEESTAQLVRVIRAAGLYIPD